MALKEINVQIGGEERTLRFGTMRTLDYAGEIFTGDPLELMYGISTIDLLKLTSTDGKKLSLENIPVGISNAKKTFEIVAAFAYAGLRSGGTVCTTEQVIEWVSDLDYDTGAMILSFARSTFAEKKVEVSGEQKPKRRKGKG